MTPHQQILAFELRRRKLPSKDIAHELGCDGHEIVRIFTASKPIEIEVPRWMTPVFIRQSVCTIMKRYRSSE